MWLINLTICLHSIIKTRALECVSVINRKRMPRPKILDVNEGVGEALFYPYNVLVNKCSGSCDTLNNPMVKMCVPNTIKRINMKVYNFLIRLNATRNVLWHESCKCICRLNSSVCNSKQIWNKDTCRCDCNEDFVGIMTCRKGYMWNPSTCECQYDMWCKPGQYLDHKNCICKNKLIGRVIEKYTSIINETIMNNKDNIANDNTITNIFVGLFSVLLFVGIVCFCVLAYFKWIKGKQLFKKYNNYYNYLKVHSTYKMFIKSLKIKNQSYYYWDDIIFIDDFDIKFFKIAKRESQIGVDIYYIGYVVNKLEYDINSVKPLYLNVKSLLGSVENIDGSINVFNMLREYVEDKIILDKIDGFDKIRFSSNIDLPLGTLIQFKMLTIIIRCIIKKDDKYYPEIYLDEYLYYRA